jgi:uncharacterized phage-like protein YoqJ
LLSLAQQVLSELEPDHVISGMAIGWDLAVAEAAASLHVPWTAAIPFLGQDDRWAPVDRQRYARLLCFATEIKILYARHSPDVYRYRDEWMVDHADLVLALFDELAPRQSGTGMTVRYAQRKSVPVLNVWRDWMAIDLKRLTG